MMAHKKYEFTRNIYKNIFNKKMQQKKKEKVQQQKNI